ncbi:hypothetical protein [Xanthobacter pseudotagetidis]|uniref:hypothetical protein n=1 Tax=Xanthobacter pseudotagetidis TaxID=3119911 RepID=UPI0037267FB3
MKSKKPLTKTKAKYSLKLRELRTSYKKLEQRHRDGLYALIASAAPIVKMVRAALAKGKKVARPIKVKNEADVPLAVMRFMLGIKQDAANNSKAKLAAKYARVLAYAYDVLKIEPGALAQEIKERGGIERLAREAAKAREDSEGPSSRSAAEKGADQSRASANDNRSDISLKIAKPEKKELLKAETGTKFRLTAVKEEAGLRISRIRTVAENAPRKKAAW